MTNKQRKYLFLLAYKKGYKTEIDQVNFLKKYFNKDFKYYENKICNQLDEEKKKYWKNEEQKAIDNAIATLTAKVQITKREQINDDPMISASEIANFHFCPVSFSIQRTFEVEEDIKMEMGSFLHETVSFRNGDLKKNAKSLFLLKAEELKEIYDNPIKYAGHLKDCETFINSDLNISCRPDFILKNMNTGKRYVIEEKYSTKAYTSEFYLNQKIQLMAYLLTIPDVEYGYVITWNYYSDDRNKLKLNLSTEKDDIEKFRINRNDIILANRIKSLLEEMRKLILNGELNNPISYSSPKCAKCSVADYCSHKSTKSDQIRFPYE